MRIYELINKKISFDSKEGTVEGEIIYITDTGIIVNITKSSSHNDVYKQGSKYYISLVGFKFEILDI